MKVCKELVDKRREELIKIVQENTHITVEELVKRFNVSAVTIRRDLQYWEDCCAIERSYGGASILQEFFTEHDTHDKKRYTLAIAKKAASFVKDNDVIFINSSSTALSIINYITAKHVTIITNNAKAININNNDNFTILFTGGEVGYPKNSMTGDIALQTLSTIYANKSFIGCSGLSENGVSTGFIKETLINKMMIDHSKEGKYILCDYTKIGLDYNFNSCSLNDMDVIITNTNVDQDKLDKIKALTKANIIQVDPLNRFD